ncbi:proline-rich protein 35 [Alosa pseudoharengus]|uniref:proline-rich protein 35 n=1 Tax=Alosa pseudoharengus TaxID=34774 RepID=UPI003F8A8F52
MSKEEQPCKVTTGCGKHKERKPKKPHYIPRPWGKPYNYKCFQCPFTCMEKSHLYNHMKYSLCKNSLSLLIDSDWPYKKGNLLHANQLRLQAGLDRRSPSKEQAEQAVASAEHSPTGPPEEDQRGEEPLVEEGPEGKGAANERLEHTEGGDRGGAKHAKQEADVVMADAFSLEEQLLRARSFEVESRLRQYRLPKAACLSTPALLPESWRLLGYPTQTKPKAEAQQPVGEREASSLPCYPPPPPPEPPALNLSLLGLSYPLTPSLFSYLNPATSHAHAQLATLPFLTHPHAPAERALLPPRFYYPFLCEHSLGAPPSSPLHASKALKSPQLGGQETSPAPTTPPYPAKLSLWGAPAVRPTSTQASPAAWALPESASPEPGLRAGDRSKAGVGGLEHGAKRPAAHLESSECPVEKKPALSGVPLDFLKNLHRNTPSAAMATDKLLLHSSVDEWYTNLRRATSESPPREVTSPAPVGRGGEKVREQLEERDREREAVLLEDLSSALQEYQQAEHRAATILARDGTSAQLLWDHLTQIRSQLSHITQALQRTAPNADGPLDLSVKKDPSAAVLTRDCTALSFMGETSKEDMSSESEEEEEEEERDGEEEEEDGGREMKEKRKRSLDLLIKLNQTGIAMVKGEGMWAGRTTKCEADSSVLLCPKHTHTHTSNTHTPPASHPHSPLTAADT